MFKQKLVTSSYVACASLAAGSSIGPWITIGGSTYSLADGYGLITLIGSALVALAIWRWSVSRQVYMLIGAGIVALLCLCATAYDVLDVTYFDDAEGFGVGWGLLVALVASVALVCLYVLILWRIYSEKPRATNSTTIGLLAVALAVLVGSWIFFSGDAAKPVAKPTESVAERNARSVGKGDRSIPHYALEVASGRFDDTRWGVWVYGDRQKEICWGTREVVKHAPEEEGSLLDREASYCGVDVPPRQWELIAEGPWRIRANHRWALVFITQRDVGHVNVLTGRGRLSWTRAKARVIAQRRARKAHLRSDFRYAVASVPQPGCLRRVVVFDRAGRVSQRTPRFRCRYEDTLP